jgi:hypothetical protein
MFHHSKVGLSIMILSFTDLTFCFYPFVSLGGGYDDGYGGGGGYSGGGGY